MLGAKDPWSFAANLAISALWLFLLMRFGFMACVLAGFVLAILLAFPVALDTSAWYSGYGYAALTIFAAIVLYAFRTSLGGRPIMAAPHLDD
jgi:hypothetical protein